MIKFLLKKTYLLILLFSTVGGVFAFYQQLNSRDEYGLTLFLKQSEQIIENKNSTIGLSMLFNGIMINSLYLTKIQLQNSGKRALTKDFIYEALTIHTGPSSKILQVNATNKHVTYTTNRIIVKWDLLNPNEVIEISIFTSRPIQIATTQKIKEIESISLINEVTNAPVRIRLKSLSFVWPILILLSFFYTLDAIFLIKGDVKLGKIFGLVKSLPELGSIDKEYFLTGLLTLYKDYYQSVPILFVKPEMLIERVSQISGKSEVISGRDLERVSNEVINYVRFANLYSTRSAGLFFGPILFLFSVTAVLFSLFK